MSPRSCGLRLRVIRPLQGRGTSVALSGGVAPGLLSSALAGHEKPTLRSYPAAPPSDIAGSRFRRKSPERDSSLRCAQNDRMADECTDVTLSSATDPLLRPNVLRTKFAVGSAGEESPQLFFLPAGHIQTTEMLRPPRRTQHDRTILSFCARRFWVGEESLQLSIALS
jgi:hypothetical protein